LHKLKNEPETSKEHPRIKITQNNNKNKKIEKRRKDKQRKMLSEISKGILNIQNLIPDNSAKNLITRKCTSIVV